MQSWRVPFAESTSDSRGPSGDATAASDVYFQDMRRAVIIIGLINSSERQRRRFVPRLERKTFPRLKPRLNGNFSLGPFGLISKSVG
jgi:hypothetical protein